MSNTNGNKKTPVADLIAQAKENNLVTDNTTQENPTVPAQTTPDAETTETNQPELEVIEGGKKTIGQHIDAGIEKLKSQKKVVIGVAAAVGVAALAFAKFAAKQAAEAAEAKEILSDVVDEQQQAVDVVTGENTEGTDESAA